MGDEEEKGVFGIGYKCSGVDGIMTPPLLFLGKADLRVRFGREMGLMRRGL